MWDWERGVAFIMAPFADYITHERQGEGRGKLWEHDCEILSIWGEVYLVEGGLWFFYRHNAWKWTPLPPVPL